MSRPNVLGMEMWVCMLLVSAIGFWRDCHYFLHCDIHVPQRLNPNDLVDACGFPHLCLFSEIYSSNKMLTDTDRWMFAEWWWICLLAAKWSTDWKKKPPKGGNQSAKDLPIIPLVVHAVPLLGIMLCCIVMQAQAEGKIIEDHFWISSCIIYSMRCYIMIDVHIKRCNSFSIDLKYKSQRQFKFAEHALTRSTIILWTSN